MESSMSGNREPSPRHRMTAVRLTAIFLVSSGAWIVLSDLAVEWMIVDVGLHASAQTVKGLLYVLATTGLVFWLSRQAFRKVAEETTALHARRSEQLVQTIMANLGDAVLLLDGATRSIVRCNSPVEKMFGYTPEELVGKTTQILHPDQASFESMARKGEPELERHGVFRCELPLTHKNGSFLQTEITVVALQKELGWRAGIVSIVRDITARRDAESALRASENRYRLLAEHTLDIIWEMDPDCIFTYVNPAVETLTGYVPSEFVGSHLHQHCDPSDRKKLEQLIHDEIAKGPHADGVIIEMDLLKKDGSSVPAEVHGKVIFDGNGAPVAIQGSTRDISHRKILEAELRQSQKLQAIGTFAGGVIHEINNPIMGITGYAELLADGISNDSKMQEYCTEIQREAGRIHSLTQDLLEYARNDEKVPAEPAALDGIVESTLSLVRTVIRHDHIALTVDVPNDLPYIRCRRQQIQQVVMNLVTNARDALNAKYPDTDDNKRLSLAAQSIQKTDQQWVRLTVEDRGTGISGDVQNRMFDPFFTTKPQGKGTGLGMWIVYRIVHEHGGMIDVESETGAFSRFHVDLPIA